MVPKRRKFYEEPRKPFRYLMEQQLYEEIYMRSRRLCMSMTQYITRVLVDHVKGEQKYE